MFRSIEEAARLIVSACQQGEDALELDISSVDGKINAIDFPWPYGNPGQDPFQLQGRSTFNMPGYTGQLEPLSYARLFAVVMIHADIIAQITACCRWEMAGFYTHVSLEFFEETANLLQKIKKLKVDEKDRATLRGNLATIYALTEWKFRLCALCYRESIGYRDPYSLKPSSAGDRYFSNPPWYEERELDNLDQLDSVQGHGRRKSLSQWAEAERSSIIHDQRWTHLRSYAAHWLEKIGEGPNKSFPAELAKWKMARVHSKRPGIFTLTLILS